MIFYKKHIFIIALLGLIVTPLFDTKKAYATSSADKIAYTNNVLAGVKENPEWVVHFFRIDVQFFPGVGAEDNQHSVIYKKEKTTDECWKLSKGSYFSINGSFYGCYSAEDAVSGGPVGGTTGASTFLIYKKKDSSKDAKFANMTPLTDADYNSLPSDRLYQKNYMKVVNEDLRFDMTNYEEAIEYYFPGSYTGIIHDKGGEKPVIEIPDAVHGKLLGIDRPTLKFELFDVDGWRGTSAADQNNFYFKTKDIESIPDKYLAFLLKERASTNPDDKSTGGLRIKLKQDGTGSIIYKFGSSQWNDYTIASMTIPKDSWWNTVINRVYNGEKFTESGASAGVCGEVTKYKDGSGSANPPYASGIEPMTRCINADKDGWLVHWLGEDWKFDKETPFSALDTKDEVCGSLLDFVTQPTKLFARIFCALGMMLKSFATTLMNFAEGKLLEVTGVKDSSPSFEEAAKSKTGSSTTPTPKTTPTSATTPSPATKASD